MDEKRLIEIETKLAHQEHLVLELNQVIADQQQQIAQLELKCQGLLDRMKSLSNGASASDETDQRPPHY